MKVSIITVVYNGASTIERAINSVLNQDYPDIEYVVIDGASIDGTLSIINQYSNCINRIVSEPDKGLYDAMNKGIQLCSGDIIGILNADDVYHGNNVISKVVNSFQKSSAQVIYGDLVYVKDSNNENYLNRNRIVRYWRAGEYKKGCFLKGWMPPHPTFFVKKEVYDQYGLFDENLKISADYELMLRFLHKYEVEAFYIPEILVEMQIGGSSNTSLKSRLRANKEDRLSWKKNNLKPKFYTLIAKPFKKLKQFLLSPLMKKNIINNYQ